MQPLPAHVTLYFASADGQIWSIPAGDGEPRLETSGQALVFDPLGRYMVIGRQTATGSQLLRRDLNGAETIIPIAGGVRPTSLSIWPGGLDAGGRLVFVAESDRSWFWSPAVVDLNTSQVTRIPLACAGDAEVNAAWDGDRIPVLARRLESAIWRFDRSP